VNAESSVVASGIPGLDGILGGGLPTEGVIFVVGAPGTGKTVLLQQLAFQAAAAGRTALYFSGFSEPHERLLEHLRPLAFFDDKLLGRRLHLLSLAATLVENPADAVSTVVQTARRTGASLVLVDGFLGLQGLFQGETAAVQFLYTLGAQLGMVRALLVVAVEADPRAVSLYPVVAVGDALLALYLERAVVGHRRYLEVLKRRGAEPLLGLHTFTISRAGLRCYPQFELTVPPVDNAFDSTQRAPFDLPEFDALLQGGVTRQTTTILTGSPGTGKTLLGLQFLAAGVARGETGVLLSFHETRAQLLDKAAAHGIALAEAIARDQIRLLLQSPVAFDPDILAQQLQVALNETRASRLVVDSVRDLEASLPHDRVEPTWPRS
jgi:circadian clock protein KaiC